MSAKRVLVTGGAGFVGANLAQRLRRDGHDVHLLVRPSTDPWRLAAAQVDAVIHAVDVADALGVQQVVAAARPDWVFHLAAHGAHAGRRGLVETNVSGTMHLLDACCEHGFEAFVHAGSSSEYGFKHHPVSEIERPDPNSPYAVTKLAATGYCAHVARTRNLRIVTLRLYSVYGPLEEPNRLVPSLIVQGLRGRYPSLAHPRSCHDFVHVDDVVEAFLMAADTEACRGGGIFNIASGQPTSLADIVDVTRTTLGVPGEPVWGTFPSRAWDSTFWAADITHAGQRLGWRPRRSLAQGVRLTIDWFRRSGETRDRYERQTPAASMSVEAHRSDLEGGG